MALNSFSFRRLLVFVAFLFFFVIDVRAMEDDATEEVNNSEQEEQELLEEKQQMLQKEIVDKGYDTEKFIGFVRNKKGEEGEYLANWGMGELRNAVKEFQTQQNPLENPEENLEVNEQDVSQDQSGPRFDNGTNINHNQSSSLKNPLYEFSKNKIARRVFDFYRYGGKFLASLVWSVVNSYCGFEEIVMNDWYCFKYAMCLGYRLQPRFMGSCVWIDMNFNFLEGIVGFLIRFFIFGTIYKIQENIFDFFNVCIDIKVYNNLYFVVNIVGIVQGVYCLLLRRAREKIFEKYSAEKEKN